MNKARKNLSRRIKILDKISLINNLNNLIKGILL